MFAEQVDSAHGVRCETHGQHQSLGTGGLRSERLPEAILRIAADRKLPREIVEESEFLDEFDVGLAGARVVAGVQLEELRAQGLGHAASLQILVSDHVAREEREHSADL